MKTWMKRSLLAVAVVAGLGAAALFGGAALGERKLQRHVEVAMAPVAWRTDAASIERGDYLFRSRGCADCHGRNGAGHVVVDDGQGLLVRAPNITTGRGGVVSGYQPADWVRTIRHGVKPDGRPVLVMPSEEYNRLTDADVAALVGYVRQLPPVAGAPGEVRLPLPMKALYAAGLMLDAAEKIDHTRAPALPVAEGVTAAHGAYVANGCIGCHRASLEGGKIAGAPPSWPAAARLVPGEGNVMPRYASEASFAAMLKTGKRPDGSAVSRVMPFAALGEMNDVDVKALYLYLRELPPQP